MYFLPTIIGREKSDAGLIFLVNLLLGWTIVGWIVAFIWACAAETRPCRCGLSRLPVPAFLHSAAL